MGLSVFIGSSTAFGFNSGGFLEASLCRMRAKCFTQRANCPCLSAIVSPLLFFTGLGVAAGVAAKFFSDLV